MKKYIASAILLLISSPAYAEVTKFVFVTDPQSVSISATSSTITIQSQNDSGTGENVTETIDIIFTSTSLTGKFLSTSGNPVSTTMSKNTSNKNFLYSDTNNGSFTLKIKATGRTTLKTFEASQTIKVGSGGQDSSQNNIQDTENTENTDTQIASSGNESPPEDLPVSFEVSIGKDKRSSVGSEINFKAVPAKVKGTNKSLISYSWSFGDGATANGKEAAHFYRFPGDYVVVLSANISDFTTSQRIIVHIISPDITVSRVAGGSEVINKSGTEINLEGWRLVSGTRTFIFPKDTMISPGKKIVFSDDVTGINYEKVELLNQKDKSFGASILEKESFFGEADKEKMANDLSMAKNKVLELKTKIVPAPKAVVKVVPVKIEKTESTTSNTAVVFEAAKRQGTVNAVFKYPIKGWGLIKHLFVEN